MAVVSRSLSVVIPAYNAALTLADSVASVVAQDVDGMEIIIVDDGSTDGTAALADALSREHTSVQVLHQQNGGLSAARNSGLALAQGEFITFVDSDDRLAPNTYPPLLQLFDGRPACDIVEYSLQRICGEEVLSRRTLDDNTYTDIYGYWFGAHGYEHCYACNKIFRRRVFFPKKGTPLRFTVGRTFEDTSFMAALLHRNPIITTTARGTYLYQQNTAGITSCADAAAMAQLLQVHLQVVDTCALATKTLTHDEEDYYLYVLNIQITLCQLSQQAPSLPTRHLPLRAADCHALPRVAKKVILNLFGIHALCQLWRIVPQRRNNISNSDKQHI